MSWLRSGLFQREGCNPVKAAYRRKRSGRKSILLLNAIKEARSYSSRGNLPIDRFPVPIRQQGVVAQIMHWARSFSVNVFESGQMRGNLLTLDIVNSMNWSAISGVNIASPYLTQDS
jgi:hypothetical protein